MLPYLSLKLSSGLFFEKANVQVLVFPCRNDRNKTAVQAFDAVSHFARSLQTSETPAAQSLARLKNPHSVFLTGRREVLRVSVNVVT